MAPINEAAWIPERKGNLKIGPAPSYTVHDDEVLIKNQAFAIQPLDARTRAVGYIDLPYPFILGVGVAGTVETVGHSVTRIQVGDRVVSDTPAYQLKDSRYGGWQRFVLSKEQTTAKLPDSATFEHAVAITFPLLTAVAALNLKLRMAKPGTGATGKALIWGASSSVGGYAVQYAASAGYHVVATASERKFDDVRKLGATDLVDYKDDQAVSKLKQFGPYDFAMTASGDPASANAISELLQPTGGEFASTRPASDETNLAANVRLLYDAYSLTTQKPENASFTEWWYQQYLPDALAGKVIPTPFDKRPGGLHAIQDACNDVLEGTVKNKQVLSPQES
ncbi:chaperonin 10-like protein, partial [Aspergillus avenaceus]